MIQQTDQHTVLRKAYDSLRLRICKAVYRYRARALIQESGLFDTAFYQSQYRGDGELEGNAVRHYVRYGADEGKDPSGFFDTSFYLRVYPDVAASGINPLVHYIVYGLSEGRQPSALPAAGQNRKPPQKSSGPLTRYFSTHRRRKTKTHQAAPLWSTQLARRRCIPLNHFRVVYISALPDDASNRYRVLHHVEALKACGMQAEWYPVDDIQKCQEKLISADVLVLFRVAWTQEVALVVERCRRFGAAIVYDVDDYVFEPKLATPEYVDGVRFLNPNDLEPYYDGVRRYRQALLNSDFCILTTRFLADRVSHLGRPSYVLKNGYDSRTARESQTALRKKRKQKTNPSNATVRIGYVSGTKTHQRDFQVAVPALARILDENSNVILTVVGLLDLDEFPELRNFHGRVEMRPFVDFYDKPRELSRMDINIAPLEVWNPFCKGKSELKYYEASLLELPTVASATDALKDAIQHGVTGFLAETAEDWFENLDALVRKPDLRRRIGKAAREAGTAVYGPEAKRLATHEVFCDVVKKMRARRGASGQGKVLTIVLPGMIKGSGGHAKVISIAKLLSRSGYSVLLQFTEPTPLYPSPEEIIEEFNLDADRINVLYSPVVRFASDVTFCTFWRTLDVVKNAAVSTGKIVYLLQDYEAYFYPMGSEYLQCTRTLYEPYHRISYGAWIPNLLKNRHGLDCDMIPFFIDKSLYKKQPSVKTEKEKTILFLAQADKPRRCFELGIRALARYQQKYGDAKVLFFGSLDVAAHVRAFGVHLAFTDLGILKPRELGALYNRATIGVVFSPTNLSMMALEMMACGLPVLDVDLDGSALQYGGPDNVFLVPLGEEEIADGIHELLSNTALRQRVARNGYRHATRMPDAEDVVGQLERLVEKGLPNASVVARRENSQPNAGRRRFRGTAAATASGTESDGNVIPRPTAARQVRK